MLVRERTAYFDTRVAGHVEVWAALRIICELLERGEKEEAQAIMEAAGCTCPSGEVWGRRGGIWDEKGERYVVPAWCVGVPRGCVMDGDEVLEGTDVSGVESSEDEEVKSFGKKVVVEVDKGKGRLVELEKEVEMESDLKVRVRMSNTARDFVVRIGADAKAHILLKRVREVGEVCGYQFFWGTMGSSILVFPEAGYWDALTGKQRDVDKFLAISQNEYARSLSLFIRSEALPIQTDWLFMMNGTELTDRYGRSINAN